MGISADDVGRAMMFEAYCGERFWLDALAMSEGDLLAQVVGYVWNEAGEKGRMWFAVSAIKNGVVDDGEVVGLLPDGVGFCRDFNAMTPFYKRILCRAMVRGAREAARIFGECDGGLAA